mmetsp:Transcript_39490/g.77678  ORF Transcript_39490/g.77678 Transcript_39490/m.77678 type:complete len:102 (+) Transcript_39490:340-645(+)
MYQPLLVCCVSHGVIFIYGLWILLFFRRAPRLGHQSLYCFMAGSAGVLDSFDVLRVLRVLSSPMAGSAGVLWSFVPWLALPAPWIYQLEYYDESLVLDFCP